MADYFTMLSVIVPMPKDQADWCVEFHNLCVDCFNADGSLIDRLRKRKKPDPRLGYVTAMIDDGQEYTGLDVRTDEKGLWIQSEESANCEFLAEFLGAYLRHFKITDRTIAFEWGNWCSKMRPDGFGGGACVVSHSDARWINTTSWIEETAKAMIPNAESVRP